MRQATAGPTLSPGAVERMGHPQSWATHRKAKRWAPHFLVLPATQDAWGNAGCTGATGCCAGSNLARPVWLSFVRSGICHSTRKNRACLDLVGTESNRVGVVVHSRQLTAHRD